LVRLFVAAFLAGIAVVIVSAGLLPLPDHVRYASSITVVPNGGRQERFVIHWPRDRVRLPQAVPGAAPMLTPGSAVLAQPAGMPAAAELFRLRDVAGNVIGIAAKTTGAIARPGHALESTSHWVLLIPARGALLLMQKNRTDLSARHRPGAAGRFIMPEESAQFWAGYSRYLATAGPAGAGMGRMLRGTGEFSGLTGTYAERWELDAMRPDGTTEGRIILSTVLEAAR